MSEEIREYITTRTIEKLFNNHANDKTSDRLMKYVNSIKSNSKSKMICSVWNNQALKDEEVIALLMYFGKKF